MGRVEINILQYQKENVSPLCLLRSLRMTNRNSNNDCNIAYNCYVMEIWFRLFNKVSWSGIQIQKRISGQNSPLIQWIKSLFQVSLDDTISRLLPNNAITKKLIPTYIYIFWGGELPKENCLRIWINGLNTGIWNPCNDRPVRDKNK